MAQGNKKYLVWFRDSFFKFIQHLFCSLSEYPLHRLLLGLTLETFHHTMYLDFPQTKFGGGRGLYRNHPVRLSVHLSVCLSITSGNSSNKFQWNLKYWWHMICKWAWSNIITRWQLWGEIIQLRIFFNEIYWIDFVSASSCLNKHTLSRGEAVIWRCAWNKMTIIGQL